MTTNRKLKSEAGGVQRAWSARSTWSRAVRSAAVREYESEESVRGKRPDN